MLETGTTPVIPSAPPLDRAQPNGTFVRDALYLAVRLAQRGGIDAPPKARAQIKTAILQLQKVDSATDRAYWQGQIDQTTVYVEALAADAEARGVATQIADEDYVGHQRLTPAEVIDAGNENVDLQRGLDAQAAGGEASLAYNGIPNPGNVTAKLVATVNPEGSKGAGIKTEGAKLSDLPSSVRYVLYAGVVAVILFAVGYGAFYYRAMRRIA